MPFLPEDADGCKQFRSHPGLQSGVHEASGVMSSPAILSDIGNVLVAFDFKIAARRAAELCPFPPEQLFTRLDSIKLPYENGDMDDATFVREAMRLLEFGGDEAMFRRIWCEIFTENQAMERTLAAFTGRLPMFLLSNTSGIHKDYLLSAFDIFRHFQGGVYSYSAKCSKPDAVIFEKTLAELGLEPEQTFYIDDLEANIATARRLGFQTHLYRLDDHAALERDLGMWTERVLSS
jgi:FMN phosphatase YigB (HAD superfamily)